MEGWRWLPALLVVGGLGCYAGVGEDEADGDEQADGEGEGGGSDGAGEELPAPSPRLYRLTHEQWENTVQDLFGLPEPTGLSELLRDDPQVGGFLFDNDATSLVVDEALWTGYRIAAGQIADQVTTDPDVLAGLVPPEGGSEAERIDTFVREFVERAYRRPPSEDEVADLVGLFGSAPSLYPEVADPFTAGVRHVVEAVLQSPLFLYRVERSEAVVDDVVPLDGYELASRLSYFLWNSMPDDELFAAAGDGSLQSVEGVTAEAERMLDHPRAAQMVARFHYQLLDSGKIDNISPSPNFFPDAPEDLAALAGEERERFVRDVVFGGGGGLVELLTSTETFVDAELAAIYGVEGVVGDEFVHVDLDPAQRGGVFTQVGFLAANATSVDPDPIHRGVFVAKRLVCLPIAAPPDGVPPLPGLEPDQTNRERVAAHTAGDPCASCHETLINPFGFTFEAHDAIGAWRTTDNGQPVDATANVFTGTETVAVGGAVEMMQALAASQPVHECYVEHWLEYAGGRSATPDDALAIARLGADSLANQQSVRELLVAITTSPAFLNRAAEELP